MFSSLSRKRVFVLLILTSLLLITLDRRNNVVIDKVRTGFQTALTPFDTAAEAIARPIARTWNGITDYDRLEKENQALQRPARRAEGRRGHGEGERPAVPGDRRSVRAVQGLPARDGPRHR